MITCDKVLQAYHSLNLWACTDYTVIIKINSYIYFLFNPNQN
jgi:hypothetical protein